jgi:hypothetical protein
MQVLAIIAHDHDVGLWSSRCHDGADQFVRHGIEKAEQCLRLGGAARIMQRVARIQRPVQDVVRPVDDVGLHQEQVPALRFEDERETRTSQSVLSRHRSTWVAISMAPENSGVGSVCSSIGPATRRWRCQRSSGAEWPASSCKGVLNRRSRTGSRASDRSLKRTAAWHLPRRPGAATTIGPLHCAGASVAATADQHGAVASATTVASPCAATAKWNSTGSLPQVFGRASEANHEGASPSYS